MAVKKASDLVNIKLPRIPDGPKSQTVAVNFKIWQIQRGVTVQVPREVAEAVRNSEIASEYADAYQAKITE